VKVSFSALGCGLLFGAGLALSGMVQPSKVLGFLDVAGAFDPTLAVVMAGALGVLVPAQAIARRRGDAADGAKIRRASPAARGRPPLRGLGALRRGLGTFRLLPWAGNRRGGCRPARCPLVPARHDGGDAAVPGLEMRGQRKPVDETGIPVTAEDHRTAGS